MRGWVYVIKNKAIPDLLKIGFSTKDPILRAREFNGTGVPFDFEVLFDALVDTPRDVEQAVHRALISKRENKEWFRCDLNRAIEEIRLAAGFIYREQHHAPNGSNNNFRTAHSYKQELTRPEISDLEDDILINSLKAKVLLRLIQKQLNDSIESGIDRKLAKPLRFMRLQVEELINRDKVSYEELSDLGTELDRICSVLDPDEDELHWMQISTATELIDNVLNGKFEVTERNQVFLDYTEVARAKLNEKHKPAVVTSSETATPNNATTNFKPEPQRLPAGVSKCPSCNYIFPPNEIKEFVDIWMRCPKCRQLMSID